MVIYIASDNMDFICEKCGHVEKVDTKHKCDSNCEVKKGKLQCAACCGFILEVPNHHGKPMKQIKE